MQALAMAKRVSFLAVTIGALFASIGVPAAAQDIATERAMANYRRLTSVAPKSCQEEAKGNEIVVCANKKLRDSQKVPYIEELRVGDRPRLAPGEVAAPDLGPPCPPRGCACPPSECGIGFIARKLFGG